MFLFKHPVNLFARQTGSRRFFGGKSVRVRFAPSPTGFLHLGGLRTALYNHLFAKSQNGVTILRIEDTDLTRKVPGATERLVEDLSWCGITYDEGPYFQSDRKEIYQKYVQQLVDQGDAYYCFCSSTRLNLIRKEALKLREVPRYDNHCRHLTKEEIEENFKNGKPSCIRFKLVGSTTRFDDLICGPTDIDIGSLEGDPIIMKGDGFPTYHLANVIDDHLMNISHVLRGNEWLISTPKHLLLYNAFKWDPPQYGHFPLLLNEDGTKLSKRQGSVNVNNLKEKGYLPNSLLNFVIRFGGGFDFKIEKNLKSYTFDELVGKFNITKMKSTSSQVDLKLLSDCNRAEILRLLETETGRKQLAIRTRELVSNYFNNSEHKNNLQLDIERIEHILEKNKDRISTLEDLITEDYHYLWICDGKWSETDETNREIIKKLLENIKEVNWNRDDLGKFHKTFCKQHTNLKLSDLMQTVRTVLTGRKVGPGVAEIMTTLSKEDVLFRLSKVVEKKSNLS